MGSRATMLACYAVAATIAIGISSYAGMAQVQRMDRQITSDIESETLFIASETGSRMSAVASIMQVTANIPQVKDTSDAHLASAENKGVP